MKYIITATISDSTGKWNESFTADFDCEISYAEAEEYVDEIVSRFNESSPKDEARNLEKIVSFSPLEEKNNTIDRPREYVENLVATLAKYADECPYSSEVEKAECAKLVLQWVLGDESALDELWSNLEEY